MAVDDDQRYEHRARAGEPDTPDEPRVGRIGDDHLVAVVDVASSALSMPASAPPVITTSASGS